MVRRAILCELTQPFAGKKLSKKEAPRFLYKELVMQRPERFFPFQAWIYFPIFDIPPPPE